MIKSILLTLLNKVLMFGTRSTDTDNAEDIYSTDHALHVYPSRLAGEREEGSTTGDDHIVAAEEWEATVIDLSSGDQTIYDGAAICGGIYVNTVLSAHAVSVADNATNKMTLPASLAAGSERGARPWKAYTSLKVLPNASSTGSITVFWRVLDTRVTAP